MKNWCYKKGKEEKEEKKKKELPPIPVIKTKTTTQSASQRYTTRRSSIRNLSRSALRNSDGAQGGVADLSG